MNVAIISPEYPPKTNWGGVATFNYNLAQLLIKLGHRVTVITYDGEGDKNYVKRDQQLTLNYVKMKTDFKILNFIYYRFPLGLIRRLISKYFYTSLFLLEWNFFSLLEFIKLNKVNKYKVIHTPEYYAPAFLISLLFKSIYKIVHVQGPQEFLNLFEKVNFDKLLKSKFEDIYLKYIPDKIITCNDDLRSKFIYKHYFFKDRIEHIPNFIELPHKHTSNGTEIFNKKNIIFIGRLEYRKGIDLLLKAYKKLNPTKDNIKLYIIGSKGGDFLVNNERVSFEVYYDSLNLSEKIKKLIYFVPWVEDKKALYEILFMLRGFLVMPSRYEPFGFVAIEAMICGSIPIISSNRDGSKIVEDNFNGFIVQPSVEDIYNTLVKVQQLSNNDIVELLNNCRNTIIHKFSHKSVLNRYQRIYLSSGID